MMLMFYSLYKQATIGPCNIPKPSFWDVINKAKWNAWSALGSMSKEDAMCRYVEEIKKVVSSVVYWVLGIVFIPSLSFKATGGRNVVEWLLRLSVCFKRNIPYGEVCYYSVYK